MLTIPLEKLAFIIIKAREFDVEEAEVDVDSGSNPTDDGAADVLEEGSDNDVVEQELRDAIDGLNEPERVELLALTWLGRGDYSKAEWVEALRTARDAFERKEADDLLEEPLLASYLEEGLAELGYSIDDFEIDRL